MQKLFLWLFFENILQLALSNRDNPKLWNTFGPASIMLDTKGTVKINYDGHITFTIKRKKHKFRNGLRQY